MGCWFSTESTEPLLKLGPGIRTKSKSELPTEICSYKVGDTTQLLQIYTLGSNSYQIKYGNTSGLVTRSIGSKQSLWILEGDLNEGLGHFSLVFTQLILEGYFILPNIHYSLKLTTKETNNESWFA